MSENSDKNGKATTNAAKPAKVVGANPKASETKAPGAAQPVKAAPAVGQGTPAKAPAAKKTAPAAAAAKKSAPPAKKTAPVAQKATPAKKVAPAPAAPVANAPAAAASADETAGVEDTAVRPGFGERLKGSLDKAASKAEAAAEKARARRDERREASDGSGASEPTQTVSFAGATGTDGQGARSPRHARLRLSRIDPWSVARVAFLLSVALGVVMVVSVTIVWTVLGAAGVWDALNSVIASVASSSDGTSAFKVEDYVGTSRMLGLTLVVSVVNVVLLTAMATLSAYLYNMAAALLGGVDVTLSEGND